MDDWNKVNRNYFYLVEKDGIRFYVREERRRMRVRWLGVTIPREQVEHANGILLELQKDDDDDIMLSEDVSIEKLQTH